MYTVNKKKLKIVCKKGGISLKDLSRKVSLHCPVCGNTMFSTMDEHYKNADLCIAPNTVMFKCSDCGNIISKGELLDMNKGVINANIEDIKKEATKEVEKELKRLLKKLK